MPQIEVCAAIGAESPDELGQAIASLATATALLESLEASFPPKHQPPPQLHVVSGGELFVPAFTDSGALLSFADPALRHGFFNGYKKGDNIDEDNATPDEVVRDESAIALSNVDTVFEHLRRRHPRSMRLAPTLKAAPTKPAVAQPALGGGGGSFVFTA